MSLVVGAISRFFSRLPAYRAAFKATPWLVVADGFYEWAKVGPKEKQPYFIIMKGRAPFAFAVLWEWWRAKEGPNDEPGLETFTS
jgi:putative SOS response-associated peptidase YedK